MTKPAETASRLIFVLSTLALLVRPAAAAECPKRQAAAHFEAAIQQLTKLKEVPKDDQARRAALAEFREANELCPSLNALYNIAVLQAELGQPVDAVDSFERYLKEGGVKIKPAEQKRVSAQIHELQAMIGEITIVVWRGETQVKGAQVDVDGESVGASPLPGPIRVSTGLHRVTATLDDEKIETDVEVHAGKKVVALRLQAEPSPGSQLPPSIPQQAPPTATTTGRGDSKRARTREEETWGWILAGVGGAGIASAVIARAIGWHMEGNLDRDCPGGHCPSAHWDEVDRYGTVKTISIVSATAGVVLGGVGGYLIYDARTSPGRQGARAAPFGAAGVSWSGRF